MKLEFVSASSPRQYSRHKTGSFLLGNQVQKDLMNGSDI